MASRRLVPASVRDSLLGIPSDVGSLERIYVLPDEDLDLNGAAPTTGSSWRSTSRCCATPGQGWLEGLEPPAPLVA